MNITIRKAEKRDCAGIMSLIHELAVYEKAPEAVTVDFKHFVESGFGPNPVWYAWVAAGNDDRIIGFALYYIRYSTWKGQRMYLEDLLVTEEMRGKNIGQQLFEQLITEAKEKGLSGIVWQVLDWNEPAINFYKKIEGVEFDGSWLNCSIDIQ